MGMIFASVICGAYFRVGFYSGVGGGGASRRVRQVPIVWAGNELGTNYRMFY